MTAYQIRDIFPHSEEDVAACTKCDGDGIVEDNKMGTITPLSEIDQVSGKYICPRCGGTGRANAPFLPR